MAICDFCREKLFSQRWRPGIGGREHHGEMEEWKESVKAACMICTLLFEHMRTALEKPRPWKRLTEDEVKQAKANDSHIRSTAIESILLEWADSEVGLKEIQLPIYDVTLHDAGGKEAWSLYFRPRSQPFGNELAKQRFFVYAAIYDGISADRADQTEVTANYDQIAKWSKICEDPIAHPHCRKLHQKRTDDSWVPTRLIDVSVFQKPRVVETGRKAAFKDKNGDQFADKYVTLSYKWGYDPDCLLNDKNLEEYKNEMPWDKMPPTFQDAVTATRALGVRYLWIDALCMLQQNAEEFLKEAPTMREVYGNSYLSLAGVSADNNAQGIFRKRTPGGASPCLTDVKWTRHQISCIVIREDFWKGEVLSEPLYARGWCFQERLLAPRIVHCQKRQLFWQCPSLTACEAVPNGLSKVIEDERKDELRWRGLFHREQRKLTLDEVSDLQEIWRQAVTSYTSCDLTKNRDKLMAICGVAGKMQREFIYPGDKEPEKYFVGLWEKEFPEQLAWKVTKYRPAFDPLSYRAPSWSWASTDAVVEAPVRLNYDREYVMEIAKGGLHVHLADPEEPTGNIRFASLTATVELYRPLKFISKDKNALAWQWTGFVGAEHTHCFLHLDRPITVDAFSEVADAVKVYQDSSANHVLECWAAMVAYERDSAAMDETEQQRTYTGFALALRAVRATKALTYCRIGKIEFQQIKVKVWDLLQKARDKEEKKKDEVAPSSDSAKDKRVITLL